MQDIALTMAEFWYRMFWRECGTHGLTLDQKIEVLKRLNDFSLKYAYWAADENAKFDGKTLSDHFPELIPAKLCRKHAHLNKISGLLLYVMHTEIANEVMDLAKAGKLTKEQISILNGNNGEVRRAIRH
ncbi:MAG: hypothetical protein QW660_03620 [Candidatus Bathyarchaeia archaeon]